MLGRNNQKLNEEIERQIDAWRGTGHGVVLKTMYENDADYESICEMAGIDYEDYEE